MNSKTLSAEVDMVMQVSAESKIPLYTLAKLAFRYCRQEHSDEYIQEAVTQFVNHAVIPEPLLDIAIDVKAGRITLHKDKDPQTQKMMVWIVKV